MVNILIPTIKSRRDRLEKCIKSIRDNTTVPYMITIFENDLGGFVPAIHKMLENVSGTVWCIGDDTIVNDNAVDKLYQAYIETYPNRDGVVQPDDGIQHGNIITMPMCDARTMQKYTFKGYNHWYADNEFTDIMKEKGLYTYLPEIQVDHYHWVNGKAEQNESYLISLKDNEKDRELYIKRRQNNFEPKNELNGNKMVNSTQ